MAQAMRGMDRRQITWINQRHISEEALDKAITEVINGYNRFLLPSLWGSGERASADGTKWDLYEQNLLSEYHIRYGGYGGIAYLCYAEHNTNFLTPSFDLPESAIEPFSYSSQKGLRSSIMLSYAIAW